MEREAVQGGSVFFCLLFEVLLKAVGRFMGEKVLLYVLGADSQVVGAVEIIYKLNR